MSTNVCIYKYACIYTSAHTHIHTPVTKMYTLIRSIHIFIGPLMNTHTHTQRMHTYIYIDTLITKNTHLHWLEVKRRERTKKVTDNTTQNLHGQLTPIGHRHKTWN